MDAGRGWVLGLSSPRRGRLGVQGSFSRVSWIADFCLSRTHLASRSPGGGCHPPSVSGRYALLRTKRSLGFDGGVGTRGNTQSFPGAEYRQQLLNDLLLFGGSCCLGLVGLLLAQQLDYFWLGLGDHVGCLGLNPGWSCAKASTPCDVWPLFSFCGGWDGGGTPDSAGWAGH